MSLSYISVLYLPQHLVLYILQFLPPPLLAWGNLNIKETCPLQMSMHVPLLPAVFSWVSKETVIYQFNIKTTPTFYRMRKPQLVTTTNWSHVCQCTLRSGCNPEGWHMVDIHTAIFTLYISLPFAMKSWIIKKPVHLFSNSYDCTSKSSRNVG